MDALLGGSGVEPSALNLQGPEADVPLMLQPHEPAVDLVVLGAPAGRPTENAPNPACGISHRKVSTDHLVAVEVVDNSDAVVVVGPLTRQVALKVEPAV